ncbi:MAG: metallophosphoesterase family protein [bacterium]
MGEDEGKQLERIALISDIHANLEALEAVLADIEEQKPDAVYCLGDVVGYGPNPRECLAKVREISPVILRGNHEAAVARNDDASEFNDVAQAAVLWTRAQLGADELDFLAVLPLTCEIPERDILLVHATPGRPEKFYYLLWEVTPSEALTAFARRFCFVGHSHVPGIFVERFGRVQEMGMSVALDPGARYLVNVGSVGQPRDGNPMAAWCLVDFGKGAIKIRRVAYGLEKTQEKILAAGLPPFLASRLSIGK